MEFMSSLQGGIDELKPSLFELLSEQQLAALLPPSLRYLLALATHRHPRYLIHVLNNFDEAYALLMLLVERSCLKTYGGGFTENFYGLKRERLLRVKGGELPRTQIAAPGIVRETAKLREVDVWKNLAVMVGIPYLKRKLDESYDIYAPRATLLGPNYNRDALPPDPTIRQTLLHYYKWFLRNIYPSVNATYYLSLLVYNLAYLFDTSKFHSPFLWLINTRLRRMGESDYRAIAAAMERPVGSNKAHRPGQTTSLFSARLFTETIYPRLLSSLRILLPTSIFALKFLEWWHASDFARQLSRKAIEDLELPTPIIAGLHKIFPPSRFGKDTASGSPKSALKDKTGMREFGPDHGHKPPMSTKTGLPIFTVTLPENNTACPICLGPVQTATATPYGFVFCYGCIHRWVEGETERQLKFMEGAVSSEEEAAWGDEKSEAEGSREGRWEDGRGRCAVSGRRILGGTQGLRRVVV